MSDKVIDYVCYVLVLVAVVVLLLMDLPIIPKLCLAFVVFIIATSTLYKNRKDSLK